MKTQANNQSDFARRSIVMIAVCFCALLVSTFASQPNCFGQEFREPNISGETQPYQGNQVSPHLQSDSSIDLGVQQSGSTDNRRTTDFVRPYTGSPKNSVIQNRVSREPYDSRYQGGTQTELPPSMADTRDNYTSDGREIIRQRYPDGKVQVEREVAQDEEGNYFNHGLWRVLDREGQPIAEGEYRQGKMHGAWQRKHSAQSSGLFATEPFTRFQPPFISAATFTDDALDGVWTLSDSYERKIFEVPYKDGVRHGTATWWFPSMLKMREANFKDGLLDGRLMEWDEQKKVTRNEEFIEGQKIIRNITFYRPNQKESESYYRDAKLEVDGQDNWWDAEPAPMVASGERVQHGPAYAWHSNGLPKMRGTYSEGVKVGAFQWWYENGNKQLGGEYNERGDKIGLWTWRHENGMKKIQGNYEDGVAVGVWRWWDSDGRVEAVEDLSEKRAQAQEAAEREAAERESADQESAEQGKGQNNQQDASEAGEPETGSVGDLPEGSSEPASPKSNDNPFGIDTSNMESVDPIEKSGLGDSDDLGTIPDELFNRGG